MKIKELIQKLKNEQSPDRQEELYRSYVNSKDYGYQQAIEERIVEEERLTGHNIFKGKRLTLKK